MLPDKRGRGVCSSAARSQRLARHALVLLQLAHDLS